MVSLVVSPLFTLKVSLLGIKPLIWRRIIVRGDIDLYTLHDVIQIAMGWTDCHLHQYFVGKMRISEPDFNDDAEDEGDFTLADIASKVGAKFRYEYDFGDSWIHEVQVEAIENDTSTHKFPICTDGARNCPPEDVGGIWGYSELVSAMEDRKHERYKEFIDWLGEPFKPEAFDLKGINKELRQIKYVR